MCGGGAWEGVGKREFPVEENSESRPRRDEREKPWVSQLMCRAHQCFTKV